MMILNSSHLYDITENDSIFCFLYFRCFSVFEIGFFLRGFRHKRLDRRCGTFSEVCYIQINCYICVLLYFIEEIQSDRDRA